MSIMETNMIIIDKIKREMGAHDTTKSALAEKLGISRTTINQKLNGDAPWTVAELEELAKIYKKERSYFF